MIYGILISQQLDTYLNDELTGINDTSIRVHVSVARKDELSNSTGFSKKYLSRFTGAGVATYCRESATPVEAEDGLTGAWTRIAGPSDATSGLPHAAIDDADIKDLDSEGRCVVTRHRHPDGHLAVLNVYCP